MYPSAVALSVADNHGIVAFGPRRGPSKSGGPPEGCCGHNASYPQERVKAVIHNHVAITSSSGAAAMRVVLLLLLVGHWSEAFITAPLTLQRERARYHRLQTQAATLPEPVAASSASSQHAPHGETMPMPLPTDSAEGETTFPSMSGVFQKGDYIDDTTKYGWQTLPEIFQTMAALAPQEVAVQDPIHKPPTQLTYAQLDDKISRVAAALQAKGLNDGDCVSLFSENSHRWLITDQAILRAGGCNAVRGVRAPVTELQYIYQNSESVSCVVESPEQLDALLQTGSGLSSKHGAPRFIVVLFADGSTGKDLQAKLGTQIEIVTFDELVGPLAEGQVLRPALMDGRSVATLVYTSGTTNKPKGVVLRHENLLHQVHFNTFSRKFGALFNPCVGDTLVSVLPCWHIFERTCEYWLFSKGIRVVYSNVKNFKSDLTQYRPEFLCAVPRLFETIYRGVQQKFAAEKPLKRRIISFFTRVSMLHVRASRTFRGLVLQPSPPSMITKLVAGILALVLSPMRALGDKLVWSKVREGLGGRIKVMVAGGSSMPLILEDFFEMVRATVIVGYGMTETSPVITNRVKESNMVGSVGGSADFTDIKIVDPETKRRLPTGEAGIVMVKGPQVMSGYKNDPEATKAVFDEEGYLDTGDLGRFNPGSMHLVITGRAKDTIVLSNGENISPQSIEDRVLGKSTLVDQMMCVGQDQKQIGALVVPNVKVLAEEGLMDEKDADAVMKVWGPQVLTHGLAGDSKVLSDVGKKLNSDPRVRRRVLAEIARLQGRQIPDVETVGEVYIVLEPFSMANNLMTQTLKIKRNVVADRYSTEIQGMYQG